MARVNFPRGKGLIDLLFKRARARDVPAELVAYGHGDKVQMLDSICRELQRMSGGGPFPCRAERPVNYLAWSTSPHGAGCEVSKVMAFLKWLSEEAPRAAERIAIGGKVDCDTRRARCQPVRYLDAAQLETAGR
jgi:hypothetical protein